MSEIRLAEDQMNVILDELHDLKRVIFASALMQRAEDGMHAIGSFFIQADKFLNHKYPPEVGTRTRVSVSTRIIDGEMSYFLEEVATRKIVKSGFKSTEAAVRYAVELGREVMV